MLKRTSKLTTLALLIVAAIAHTQPARSSLVSPASLRSFCPSCVGGASEQLSLSPLRSGAPSALYQLGYDVTKILNPKPYSKIDLSIDNKIEPRAISTYTFDESAFRFETPYYSSSAGISNSPMAPWNSAGMLPLVGALYYEMGKHYVGDGR